MKLQFFSLTSIPVALLLLSGIASSNLYSQGTYDGAGTTYVNAPLRFGFYGGANFNWVGAGAQKLTKISNDPLFTQPDLNDGKGVGFYFGAIGEYNSNDILGAALKLSIDDRSAHLEDYEHNRKLSVKFTYITIEPMIRFNMVAPGLHLSVGPQLAVNLAADYDYTPAAGDNFAQALNGEPLGNINNVAFGLAGDIAYDLNLGNNTGKTKWYLTPFLGVSYINDQKKTDYPNDQDTFDDTWSTVTVRAGVGVKFGAVE